MLAPSRQIGLCVVAISAATAGCSSGERLPETYPVTGVVTLDGSPAEGVTVSLRPIGQEGAGATTTTGSNGEFRPETAFLAGRVYKPGMLPGEYAVTLRKLDYDAARNTNGPVPNVLPREYANPRTTKYQVSVTPEGPNTIEIAIKM